MKLAITTLALTALCTMPAMATVDDNDVKMMTEQHMKMMDANGDGTISAAEHEKASKEMFMKADTNGDKKVSKDEVMAMIMKKRDMMNDDSSSSMKR